MDKSKEFWEKKSSDYNTAFEELHEVAEYLETTETRHLFKVLSLSPEFDVLDLGCGVGRWAFEFAPKVKSVVAIDFSEGMIRRAREKAEKLQVENISFDVGDVSQFLTDKKFDLILISGVLVYFDDEQLKQVVQNVAGLLKPNGVVISRETIGIHEEVQLRNEFVEKIKGEYSAVYRLPNSYITLFEQGGLTLSYSNDFTPLNFPMIFFRKFTPAKFKQSLFVRKLLKLGLKLQLICDPILLKNPKLYQFIQNRFWKIKSMLFIYGKTK